MPLLGDIAVGMTREKEGGGGRGGASRCMYMPTAMSVLHMRACARKSHCAGGIVVGWRLLGMECVGLRMQVGCNVEGMSIYHCESNKC